MYGALILSLTKPMQCFCGTAEEFDEDAEESDQCGLVSEYLCTGNPNTACGGYNAIGVYQRTGFSLAGCFQDKQASRIMEFQTWEPFMSAEVRPSFKQTFSCPHMIEIT